MSRNDYVLVQHNGVVVDRDDLNAVLFSVDCDEPDDQAWIPRSLLESYDDDEMWIPEWKAEEIGADYE